MHNCRLEQSKSGAVESNGDAATNIKEAREAAEGNKFQQAVAAWRTLDLTKLVSSLDTSASELVSQQKDSLVQRKDLAQKTKDFRKLDDASKLNDIKGLLKCTLTLLRPGVGFADHPQHIKASSTSYRTSPSRSRPPSSSSTPRYPKRPIHTRFSRLPSTRW